MIDRIRYSADTVCLHIQENAMGDRIKVGDNLAIDYFAIGIAPQIIFSDATLAGHWLFQEDQLSIFIQNRSGANIEISTTAGAANGIVLFDGQGITFDIGPNWAGAIYGVVGTITVAVAIMRATG